jgi:lipoprotein-anchoring transpeptidase ErfK/SrfK
MTGAGSAANGRFSCVAVLAVGLVICAGSQSQAARYYWSDGQPDFDRPSPRPSPRQHKERIGQSQKKGKPERESAKPQGPLIISISINQQRLKIYDANGVFAESPVSTGMHGHSTPMGVFSVIQKQKLHHSNIYSNAPMPYMQRITWSGVAMHAGVLPGYPASHGCIRMPMAFAMKMWTWTRMGARVVVTPGELMPASFAHALLPTEKVAPQPVAAVEPEGNKAVGANADKGALDATVTKADSNGAKAQAASSAAAKVGADLVLRTSLGQEDSVKTATSAAMPTPREPTRTADAGSDAQTRRVTMSDASSGSSEPQHADGAAKSGNKSESVTSTPGDARNEAKADDTTAPRAARAAATADPAEITAKSEAAKSEAVKSEAIKPEAASVAAKPDDRAIDARIDPAKAAQGTADAAKDKAAAVRTEPPRRAGQIAVFISRKDSKLYVRQNFAPLFEVPVTIAPSDRPLGTHVFTAQVDRTDANVLHWSVVTVPVSVRSATRADEERGAQRRKAGAAVEAKPLPVADTPAEALDRIGIPADAMTRVSDALTSGGSIIVSDQGINQGETGEGTDFIVSLQ